MSIRTVYYHTVALAGFFGLFLLLMLWNTVLSPSAQFPVAMTLLVTVTPLLLTMRGLLAAEPRGCIWSAYVSLLYFIHGAAEFYAIADQRLYAGLEILFSLMLFFGASLYVRFAGKHP